MNARIIFEVVRLNSLEQINRQKFNQQCCRHVYIQVGLCRCVYRMTQSDFSAMIADLAKNINWRIALFLYVAGVFIFSDVFVELVLSHFSGTVYGADTTTKGTMLQLLFLVLAYIIFDLLVAGNVL